MMSFLLVRLGNSARAGEQKQKRDAEHLALQTRVNNEEFVAKMLTETR